jgi:FkbM family methyltransferase
MASRQLAKAIMSMGRYMQRYGFAGPLSYFRQQLLIRLTPGGSLVAVSGATDNEPVWLRARFSDYGAFYQIFVSGEYDVSDTWLFPELLARYERIISEGKTPVVIDAGANIGLASRYFARLFPLSHVVALEPDPENCAVAAKNLGCVPNVTVLAKGLWSHRTRIMVVNPDDASWAFQFKEAPPESLSAVESVSIDDAVATVANGRLFLVKMDIEGAESVVLGADGAWWTEAPVIIIEPHDWMAGKKGSLEGLFRREAYRGAAIIIKGENLVCVPAAPSRATEPPLPLCDPISSG